MLRGMGIKAALAAPIGFRPSMAVSSPPLLGCRSSTATSTATSSPSSWSICCQTTSPSPRAPSCWVSGCLGQAGRMEDYTPEPLAQSLVQPPLQWAPGGRGQNLGCSSSPQLCFPEEGAEACCGCEGLGLSWCPLGDGATQGDAAQWLGTREDCSVTGLAVSLDCLFIVWCWVYFMSSLWASIFYLQSRDNSVL